MLVLLHGFTHTGASWDPVVAELPGSYRVLAPDIRGHGSASEVEPVSLEGVVEDIRTLEPVVLCGYSMGARLALHVALAAPSVRRLVLIGGSPGLADPSDRAARRAADELLADEIERLTIEEVADRWAAGTAVLAGQPASVAAAAREDRLRNTPAGLARALRGLGTGALPSLWDRLGEIIVPVTLIVGEQDVKFRAIADQMAPLFGGHAEVVVVPGSGHAVHLEAPQAVAATM
ncbi:MAG TPA: alpha/beta fold hydrolase [Solirubrobacteraceae bacterium]|jgi:2-succinyl-6-hydroxy-2,4-cyclohexadiene-1-carboxylate synthase|nr:alpha/beta fold hydrolase [Solirubrobacteraceae bacterium]